MTEEYEEEKAKAPVTESAAEVAPQETPSKGGTKTSWLIVWIAICARITGFCYSLYRSRTSGYDEPYVRSKHATSIL